MRENYNELGVSEVSTRRSSHYFHAIESLSVAVLQENRVNIPEPTLPRYPTLPIIVAK